MNTNLFSRTRAIEHFEGVTSYERTLPLKILYEAKDRSIKQSPSQNGLLTKLKEVWDEDRLEYIVIEVISEDDVYMLFIVFNRSSFIIPAILIKMITLG